MNEAAVLLSAKEGDESAQRCLYECYYERIFRLARRYAGSDEDAEEIMQDVFVRAFKALPRFKNFSNGSFPAWINRICINCSLSYLRKRKNDRKNRMLSLADLEIEPETRDASPDAIVQNGQMHDLVSRAVLALPPKQRIIFDLRHGRHMGVGEIAVVLKCSRSSVKTQLVRASAKLRRYLAPVWEEK